HADFNQSTFTTTYTVKATGLDNATYAWSVSIPLDPACGTGFKGNSPSPGAATWLHKDASQGGVCNHAGSLDGPRGHPGTVTVVVSDSAWTCTGIYVGTISGDAESPSTCAAR